MEPDEEILARSTRYRGLIINDVSILERMIDDYLAYYFCSGKSKPKEFIDIILGGNRISLDGKRKILDIILKKIDITFYKTYPTFKTDMNTVMYERNNFAHCTVDLSNQSLKKATTEIGLIKFSVKTRIDYYTEDRINEIREAIRRCVTTMMEIA